MSCGVARNVHGMLVSQTSRSRTQQSRNLKYNNVKVLYSRSDRLVVQWVGTSAASTHVQQTMPSRGIKHRLNSHVSLWSQNFCVYLLQDIYYKRTSLSGGYKFFYFQIKNYILEVHAFELICYHTFCIPVNS